MLVLALDTGEKIDKETAWQCKTNHKYYSSEEGYKKWKKNKYNEKYQTEQRKQEKQLSKEDKEYLKKCNDKIYDWLGYNKNSPKPALFFARTKFWHDKNQCSYEVIYTTMEMIENDVFWALKNRTFDKEIQKIAYICAMINNSLIDGQKLYDRQQKVIAEAQQRAANEHYPTQEEIEMAWVQHDRTKELESIARVNETLKNLLGDDWDAGCN